MSGDWSARGRGGWSPRRRPAGNPYANPGYTPPRRPPGSPTRGAPPYGAGGAPPPPGPPGAAVGGRGPRRWGRIVRRVAVIVVVVVLVLVGYDLFQFESMSATMASSHALDGAPTSTDGGTNILLMGLDTRKDQNGQQLPKDILDQLHAGDGDEGGYNTNTLILMHIPANGGKVQAFSIPRDDAVTVPGYGQHKIKEAYGNAKADAEDTAAKQGVTDPHQLETIGREAGRKLEIQTVANLTGVPIDHFAEISLAGFYDLANALDGVQVCLNGPVNDSAYSGAVFPAGVQTLDGAQALAFVRQRHGLPNGDLDRTHRQQAFLSSASHNVRSPGTIFNPFKVTSLMNAAKSDIVIDDNWGAFSMAMQLQNLTGGNTVFQTLPITGFTTVNGESANRIDPDQIRQIIQSTFAGSNNGNSTAGNMLAPRPASGAAPSALTQGPPNGSPVQANSDNGVPCVN
jgi:LCP family protein required for cell wall assembly